MIQRFVIPGRLDGLNEYTNSNRSNAYIGAQVKKRNEELVLWAIKAAHLKPMETPVHIHVIWHEGLKPGAKRFQPRDKDNVRVGIKFIQDALVKAGIIDDDSWAKVTPTDDYVLDRDSPHIEVVIEEI